MEPLFMLVAIGLAGGLSLSVYLVKAKVSARQHAALDADTSGALPTDVINMAHIRVAGAGGLGLVLMAAAVAIYVPGVREAIILGALLGAVMAFVLIRRRRATGPMPSSGQQSGANTMLAIDARETNDDPITLGSS